MQKRIYYQRTPLSMPERECLKKGGSLSCRRRRTKKTKKERRRAKSNFRPLRIFSSKMATFGSPFCCESGGKNVETWVTECDYSDGVRGGKPVPRGPRSVHITEKGRQDRLLGAVRPELPTPPIRNLPWCAARRWPTRFRGRPRHRVVASLPVAGSRR